MTQHILETLRKSGNRWKSRLSASSILRFNTPKELRSNHTALRARKRLSRCSSPLPTDWLTWPVSNESGSYSGVTWPPSQDSESSRIATRSRTNFSTRAPARPNPIGMSAVRLLSVENRLLRVAEIDILDGTPLLDIKPYVPQYDSLCVTRCGWLETSRTSATVRSADGRFEGS